MYTPVLMEQLPCVILPSTHTLQSLESLFFIATCDITMRSFTTMTAPQILFWGIAAPVSIPALAAGNATPAEA